MSVEYKGCTIQLREAKSFVGVTGPYYVHNANGFVFCAVSQYGSCYALSGEEALRDAKSLIDGALEQPCTK
mgnify:CR=1 FL=1